MSFKFEKERRMKNAPYRSVVARLIYVIVCISPDIAHAFVLADSLQILVKSTGKR